MSFASDFRSQRDEERSQRVRRIAVAGMAVVMLGVGGGVAGAWSAGLFGGPIRIGQADEAALLLTCTDLSKALVDRSDTRTIYLLARTRNAPPAMLARAVLMHDDSNARYTRPAPVIDCILTRDKAAVCDADNRALAVEFLADFLDNARRAEAELAKLPAAKRPLFEQASGIAARPRVLDAVRDHLREGRLVAADFGQSAPPEVKEAIAAVKPVRDACAQRGR
jgi:hypothetical protein